MNEQKWRVVVKVGTSTLTHSSGSLDLRSMERLVRVLADLSGGGHEVILVFSGAIAVGTSRLGLRERPGELRMKQAAAAVGQCQMMHIFDQFFSQYSQSAAQILLTGEDVRFPHRRQNFVNAMERLLELNALPIVNENDAVATDEVGESTTIGENDTLAAIVAECVGADLLILLSDIDGLYTADPRKDEHAALIPEVGEITPELWERAGDPGSALGTGGMHTKLKAAEIAMACGCDMIIANGRRPELLYDIAAGRPVGTRFVGRRGQA